LAFEQRLRHLEELVQQFTQNQSYLPNETEPATLSGASSGPLPEKLSGASSGPNFVSSQPSIFAGPSTSAAVGISNPSIPETVKKSFYSF
jgi:hypothetical protein